MGRRFFVPGFVALVVGNGVASVAAGNESTSNGSVLAGVVSIIAIAVAALSIVAVSKGRARSVVT